MSDNMSIDKKEYSKDDSEDSMQSSPENDAGPSVPPDAEEPEWTPGVYLLVGVCSDELCESHKNRTVMTHAER